MSSTWTWGAWWCYGVCPPPWGRGWTSGRWCSRTGSSQLHFPQLNFINSQTKFEVLKVIIFIIKVFSIGTSDVPSVGSFRGRFLSYYLFYLWLAEGPGVARGKINFERKFFFEKTNFGFFFSLCHPPATHECPQKISAQSVQPFGRL